MLSTSEREFIYKFLSNDKDNKLRVPVCVPLADQTIDDLCHRLIQAHSLPIYIQNDLRESIGEFIEDETRHLQQRNGEEALDRVRSGECSIDSLVAQWTKAYQNEVKVHSEHASSVVARISFGEVYHTLIHSHTLETLLNLEHTYSLSIQDILEQRDLDLNHLEQRQSEEMEQALADVGVSYTDENINQLAQRNFENTQLIESKWATELSYLQDSQKKEYKDWVRRVYEDSCHTATTPEYVQRVRALTSSLPPAEHDPKVSERLEESFTIHLGAQMKTTHNLRLLCTDPLELCRHKSNTVGGLALPQPQRLHTAMSLYSNNLSGLVLLVDDRLNFYTGLKRDFAKVCEQSTDFHFACVEDQLADIQGDIVRANDWRQETRMNTDEISLHSSSSENSAPQEKSSRLYTGDVYITRHSNLSEVHVVFHLVTDDAVRSPDLTSRDPVIHALRNILKMCFHHDIYTLSIPLLLSHDMHEEMTIPWCLKRSEIILKCVKGFMMEMSTWGMQESRTIQFLVPQGMSEEMFSNISSLVTQIFRLSNPVMARSS